MPVGRVTVVTIEPERGVCVFCGAWLRPARGVALRLMDGSAFVCCATACPPLARALRERRWEAAARRFPSLAVS